MQTYLVGGAIRDALLGRPGSDRDWVVVGATPQQLAALGYLPVGRDFPVFLHPQTREEVALARTERKVGLGYHGFTFHAAPSVTLEEDLARRDLTINAMARSRARVSGATVKSVKRAARRATRSRRTGSSTKAGDTWRSTRARRSAWPP